MDPTISVVLIVEDDPLILLHARMMLEDAGHEVLAVTNAEQALEKLKARDDVDALFTDIELPGTISGLELATTVRAMRPGIAIVITSGRHALDADVLPDGARFLAKPYTVAQMRRALSVFGAPEPALSTYADPR